VIIGASSCEKLERQKKFVFSPEVPTLKPFVKLTALEWLALHKDSGFVYMNQAIKLTGMEAYYSTNTIPRTFLILKDAAFTERRARLLQNITGSSSGDLSAVTDTAKISIMKKILLYHIIDQYVDQGPKYLVNSGQNYFFQTLFPGDAGKITLRRDVFLNIAVNQSGDLPRTKWGDFRGLEHNYVFKNGIALLAPRSYRAVPFY
jgi:hypothetical protein